MLIVLIVYSPFIAYNLVHNVEQKHFTSITILLEHISAVKAKGQKLGVTVKKGKLQTFCSTDGLSFQVGWPPEGTFELPIIQKIQDIITWPGPQGHPDLLYQRLVENPLDLLKTYVLWQDWG